MSNTTLVLNGKTGPFLLEFNWCKDISFSLFKKIANNYTDLVVTPLLKVNADLWLIFNWFQQYPKFFTAGFFSHEGPTREQVIFNVLYYFCFAAVLQLAKCSIRIDFFSPFHHIVFGVMHFLFQMAESSFSFIFHGAGFSEAAVQSG